MTNQTKPNKEPGLLTRIMKNPFVIALSLLVSVLITYLVYYLRIVALAPFKWINLLSLLLIGLCAVNVFLVSKDHESKPSVLFVQNIPGVLFFIAFIICKLILRGHS